MYIADDDVQPDEPAGLIANAPAEEETLTIRHPVDHDAVEDGLTGLLLAETFLATMHADV